MNLPSYVNTIFYLFGDNARLVGGPVRDLLQEKTPKDWDFCTTFTPEQTMERLTAGGLKPFDLSNGHGTISVVIDGQTIEITTLRIDAKTDGRHAEVEFVTDWKLDAARRDFTINAMSMDVSGQIFDYFGGVQDLNNSVVRFVGDPDQRIIEDYLRILRFFRFLGRLRGSAYADPIQLEAIKRNADGLRQISGERIWSEMQKILVIDRPVVDYLIMMMNRTNVLQAIGLE